MVSNENQNVESTVNNETPNEVIVNESIQNTESNPVVENSAAPPIPESPVEKAEDTNDAKFNEIFEELKKVKDSNSTISVTVKNRIRGGFRAFYKDMPVFLPSSHFLLKKSPSDDELNEAINKDFDVYIHELQEDETKRKTVIVSRKKMLEDNFWNSIKIGDKVKAPVSSVASFGVFLDLGGFEGLIHLSRLSNSHVDDPKNFAKKGDILEATIIELNKSKNRIALSCKDQKESPWTGLDAEFPVGSKVKGIVRRIQDFGAYIELKPGVDGLVRTFELSWTRRLKTPADILTIGQEAEFEILNMNVEKRTVGLSLKKATNNPWADMKDKYAIGSEFTAKVSQVGEKGLVVTINNEIDGFMPKSKMMSVLKGKRTPFNVGDDIDVVIADLVVEEEVLILALKETEEFMEYMKGVESERKESKERRFDRPERRDRKDRPERSDRGDRKQSNTPKNMEANGEGFSLGDLLSEKMKDSLLKK